jgi:hypothetical protein
MADERDDEQETATPDQGDVTPPHGDELRSEATFGRTDRYANADDDRLMPSDDPEAERPALSNEVLGVGDTADARTREQEFERIDDAAEQDARNAVRRRER